MAAGAADDALEVGSDSKWEEEVSSLTAEMERTSITPSTLLQRAEAWRNLHKYDDAMKDIRTALSIERDNPAAIQAMRGLLKATTEESCTSASKTSPQQLLLTATTLPSQDAAEKEKTRILRHAFEAAQRLLILSKGQADIRGIAQNGGIELLMQTLLQDRKMNGVQKVPSLQMTLLRILANLALIPELAPIIISYCNDDSIELLLDTSDSSAHPLASEMLANLILLSTSHPVGPTSGQSTAPTPSQALPILKAFIKRLDVSHPADIRVACLGALIKAVSTSDLAMGLVRGKENVMLLDLCNDGDEKIRGLVPAALARILDFVSDSDEKAMQRACLDLIRTYIESDTSSVKMKGLAAISALFQAKASFGSSLLTSNGMLDLIMDCAEFEGVEVQLATVEMLSSACANKECRTLVAQACASFLQAAAKQSDPRLRGAASVTLTKLVTANSELAKALNLNASSTADAFIDTLNAKQVDSTSGLGAVEGLAYLTMQPAIKEKVAYNVAFLKKLLALLSNSDRSLQYGIATIISNLTVYRRKLSSEEEQVRKLREMAKDVAKEVQDPLDDDIPVQKRGLLVVQAGVITSLGLLAKTESVGVRETTAQIFLNLATDKRLHGAIVQQGGARALIDLTKNGPPESIANAAQALAKVAISVDPNLAFKGQRAAELVRPLINLCNGEDGLRQFEALMALTNLGSMNEEVRTRIVAAGGIKAMEYLQFSDNNLIRRAATEALCNMMFDPQVFTSYAQAGSSHRLRMFVALTDSEDYPTRRAAAGALAILSSSENACRLIMEESRGLEVVLGMVAEEEKNGEIQHRGVECIKNLARANADFARRLEAAGAVKALKHLMVAHDEQVAHGAVEALSGLQSQGISIV
ncbi:armadillo-type protein [Phlyctochytrium arcticum]|nr:armadillo-type protein [Phlyctochytrium arcticum]